MKTLQRLAFYSCGIGSVPYKDVNRAIEFLSKTFKDIFVWPQMPNLSKFEDMTLQFSQRLPGLTYNSEETSYFLDTNNDDFFIALEELMIDYESIVENGELGLLDKYAITHDYSHAFELWLEEASKLRPQALKGQITGPFTYATSLTDTNKKCAYYDETLKETIEKLLTLKALWQIEQFKKACPDSQYIISLDEPSLSQYGSSAFLTVQKKDIVESLNSVADVIHKFGAISFTHCCGNTDWSLVTSSKIQILNFDAYNFADSILLYPEEIKSFLDRGGIIAWGLIPTLDPQQIEQATLEKVIEIFEKSKQSLCKKGIEENKIITQSIITPACGTGSVDERLAEKAMTLTSDVADYLRSKYIN